MVLAKAGTRAASNTARHSRAFRTLSIALVAAIALLPGPEMADTIRIDRPHRGAVIYDVSGNLFVEAELAQADPGSGMRFRLLIDGRCVARDSFLPVFLLYDVPAGRHCMQVLIVDRHGEVMERSRPHPFTMDLETNPYEE